MQKSNRLIGIDLSYTIALLGTVFYIYLFATNRFAIRAGVLSHSWNILALDFFPALFFFLNGTTISLTMRDRKVSSRKMLSYLIKRGMFLLVMGLAVCYIWPMNVFVTIGLFYALAPNIVQWNNAILRFLIIAGLFMAHGLLYLHVPNSIGFKLPEMHGGGLIDLTGFAFFNGYFSVLPWMLFFIAGLIFGRGEIRPRGWLPPSSLIGIAIIVFGAFLQFILVKKDDTFLDLMRFDNFLMNFRLLMPAFFCIAIGASVVLINASNYFFKVFELRKVVKYASLISSMKYSILLFQLIISLFIMTLTPGAFFSNKSVLLSYVFGATFITFYLAILWNNKISNKGPLEWTFKRISGSAKK
jgi:hypothetical protein